MNVFVKILVLLTLALGVENAMIENDQLDLPKIDAWWGPEDMKDNYDDTIRKFEIKMNKKMIKDLRFRLKNHRPFTPPLEGVAFEYGFNTDQMAGWIDYWANKYNFTERESYMNKYPHYKTVVQGLDLHFIWVKPEVSPGTEVVPLLLLHGWPGSVLEFYKTIPLLTAYAEERGFAIEVIIPSLPGFAFSSGAVRPGLGGSEIAVVFRNLMHKLGFEKFYIQGGDWGSNICRSLSTLFPDEVLGFHSNYAVSYSPASLALWFMGSVSESLQSFVVDNSTANRLYPLATILKNTVAESGYLHFHATKPDTLGIAMSDSPVALLSYILMMVSVASRSYNKNRPDGGIDELYTRDEMIDNLMLYWMNNCFTTAIRIYAETYNIRNVVMGVYAIPTTVPVCTIHARYEIQYQSPKMLKFKYTNLLHSTVLTDGGHFLAMEMPEVFSKDVLESMTRFREWHKNKYCYLNNEL